jgi:SAM-dependent methyltransferase
VTVDLGLALSFGAVAAEYDRLRPTYPSALVDDALAYAALGDSVRALEVGAGTGKATVAFAGRGVPVTAVEPDPEMAQVLRRNVSAFDVRIQVSSFEEFEPAEAYGLLYSGQAWHWVEPDVRWQLAARALAPGGAVALFWNHERPADPAVLDAQRAVHDAHAPQVWHEPWLAAEDQRQWPELSDHPLFTDFRAEIYPWRRTLATADFVARTATISRYIRLDPAVRAALLADLAARLGDTVELSMDTVLYLARRR